MSIFYCEGHETFVDLDYDGYNEINDKEYCDECADIIKSNALSFGNAVNIIYPHVGDKSNEI